MRKSGRVLIAYVWARRILLELNPASDEPVWTYFDSQHKHILDRMTSVYQTAVAEVKGKDAAVKRLYKPFEPMICFSCEGAHCTGAVQSGLT